MSWFGNKKEQFSSLVEEARDLVKKYKISRKIIIIDIIQNEIINIRNKILEMATIGKIFYNVEIKNEIKSPNKIGKTKITEKEKNELKEKIIQYYRSQGFAVNLENKINNENDDNNILIKINWEKNKI